MLTELHFYTSLAFCLLPSFPSTMISLYTSEVMHLTLNLSTLHNLSAGKKYHLKILLQGWGAGSVGVSSAVTFARRTTAATLCRQPDLCPCWEIPQHSWKRCHCDWELCFGTPKAWKKKTMAQLPKFHRFTPHGDKGQAAEDEVPAGYELWVHRSISSLLPIMALGTDDN